MFAYLTSVSSVGPHPPGALGGLAQAKALRQVGAGRRHRQGPL